MSGVGPRGLGVTLLYTKPIYLHTHVCVRIYVCPDVQSVWVHTYTHICMHTRMYVCMDGCMRMLIYYIGSSQNCTMNIKPSNESPQVLALAWSRTVLPSGRPDKGKDPESPIPLIKEYGLNRNMKPYII